MRPGTEAVDAAEGRPLVLIAGMDPVTRVGGHVSYVVAHALAARIAGFSPQIFCVGRTAAIEQRDFGVVHRVPTRVRHVFVAPIHRRPIASAVAEYLARSNHEPPHLVHGFGTWCATAASACIALSRRGVAAVPIASAYTTVVHEWRGVLNGLTRADGLRLNVRFRAWSPWVRTVLGRNERYGYLHARLVLVNYASVAELLRAAHGAGPDIRHLPYAAPMAFRHMNPAPPAAPDPIAELRPIEAPLIVSVSRHDPRKGIDVLLRALARLDADGVGFRACLVGPGRLLGVHRAQVTSLGLKGRVAIPGRVEDVMPYLQNADVFVLPSLEEGSGSVALLEALQAGAAIVSSRCDGLPEDVVDGQEALLVTPGDELQLAEALARLLADRRLRTTLATRGHRLYQDRFSHDAFVTALRDTYAELGVRP